MREEYKPNLGIMFRREFAPELLPDFARRTEAAGYDELWVVEDCFYSSGIAPAAIALASTSSLRVGLGIMPAVARNPVFTAMEIAVLARTYPQRFLPGIGHGVTGWMRQIGAFPGSQLAALEETTIAVSRLLDGDRFSVAGQEITLEDVALVFPPDEAPPLSLGVRGPKSLALSGRVGGGTILAEFSSPAYVKWAREQIGSGQAEAGRSGDHRLTVFAFTDLAATTAEARQRLRPFVAAALASGNIDSQVEPLGFLPALRELRATGDATDLQQEMPDAWIDQLTLAGTPDDIQGGIAGLFDAGVDSVVLVPLPDREIGEMERFARRLLPQGKVP